MDSLAFALLCFGMACALTSGVGAAWLLASAIVACHDLAGAQRLVLWCGLLLGLAVEFSRTLPAA